MTMLLVVKIIEVLKGTFKLKYLQLLLESTVTVRIENLKVVATALPSTSSGSETVAVFALGC